MAKRYITQLLSQKLGSYLDGLDSTDVKFSVSEAQLQMENVRIKDDALTKLKLPIQIKHGQIRKLDLRVPWLKITSCPVEITLEGIDLLLTPLSSDLWEVPDIFQPEYLAGTIEKMIKSALEKETTDQQQSYLDTFRLKILDNLKVTIKDIHIRIEHSPVQQKQAETKQSSFGILLKSLEVHTTDAEGRQIFHDRANTNKNIFKLLSIDGLAIYLNPQDSTMIHKLPLKVIGKGNHIGTMMTKQIQQYIQYTNLKEGDPKVADDPDLIYILRPLSLKVQVERQSKQPLMLNIQITLDQFSIQVLYNQLKAILVFARLAQLFQKKYGEQEKVRKYRFLKQPTMNARQKWRFAIECIRRSIKTKKGALTAFNIPNRSLIDIEKGFKPLLAVYFNLPEADRFNIVQSTWKTKDQKVFWHAIQSVPVSTVQEWVKDVVKQISLAKKQSEPEAQQQSWMGWIMGMGQSNKNDEDDLDEFFDCEDGETVLDRNTVRENTSLSVVFEVKELTILVAKLNNQNRLDGIQMYNKAARFALTSPNLNLNRFQLNVTFQESGVDLVSIDKATSKYVDCTATIKKNNHMTLAGAENSPQLTLEITKGDPMLAKQGIQYDINLQVISIVYKHYEDLIVRAWAISNIQVDEEISSAAMGTLEDLRETTQNRLHELIYKKRNRFVISVQSPVIILPVRGVFENSPVWVIRTGDMLILSEDTRKLNQDLQSQQKVISKISKRKESQQAELDEFEGYRFTLTSTALQYFHQYESYEKFLAMTSKTPTKKQESLMPPRRHDFTPQQNTHLNQREPTHSIAQFSVLEDFEIQMLLRLKKKNKLKETNTAKLMIEVQTSPIQINLSVTLYNLILNLPKIFTISKQKREDFDKENEDYNLLQKEGVKRNAIFEGKIKKQNAKSLLWEDFYAVLSGKYVYLYKDKGSQEMLENFDISNVDVQEQGVQVVVSSQMDPNIRVVFRSADGQQKTWASHIQKRTFDIQIEEYQATEEVGTMIQKRKTIIKKRAQTFAASQNSDQIQLKLSCKVPSLKVLILRLVLMPETKVFLKPLVYQDWVTFALIGMEMYKVNRELDSQLQIQFKQITLQNETLPFNYRTLLSQQQSSKQSQQVPPNQIQTSLQITINSQKQNSPLFEGLLEEIDVELSNVNLKFMPDTINQLIKLLRSTKQQKNHTEDFICQEEFRLYYQQTDAVAETNSDQSVTGLVSSSLSSITASQVSEVDESKEEATPVQTQKFFETTCFVNKTQLSRISIKVTNVQMAMLHHQYAMELFSLDASSLAIVMCDWYDHSSFEVKMTDLLLNDLTNYPYTRSPKAFFEAINKNLLPETITPNELIKCNLFEMSLQSYASLRCPLKRKKYASQLVMKISPFRINYVGEVTMRLIDYFQERFIATFMLADPYKNPKQEFEKLKKRKNIPNDKITSQTDFQQPTEITYMDITIQKAEIFARDRPFSSSYILISSPTIKVQSELVLQKGRLFLKQDIPLAIQRYKIEMHTLNFWFGASKKRKDRLSLLKKTFTIKIDFETVAYSDFIDKIDLKTMDKSSHITIKIDPVMLVLPQAVYTYILRCSDLNFAWSDRLQNEFYFIKWKHISEHYKQLKKVSAQKLRIEIQMLSLTLKHSDGSYISELLLSGFEFFMLKFMDGASNMDLKCNRFFILDQKDTSSSNINNKHAVICPSFSPMVVNLETEMQDIAAGLNQDDHDAQLVVQMKMRPNSRKSIIVTIQGLKIFVKLPLFIMLSNFFSQAFPKYNEDDVDKPVGFVGNDPDNTGCMHLDVNIHKSLICLLNRPGLKSIAFQGDIRYETRSENVAQVKIDFNQLSQKLASDSRGVNQSFVSQEKANSPIVYSTYLEVSGLTPYICSLSYLVQGDVDFNTINKRQLHNPLNLSMDQKYILTPEQNEDQEETGNFGVTLQTVIKIKKLMLKLSILDLHLIMQAAAYMSEQMAEETVSRLRHIEQSIDRDFIQNQLQDDLVNQIDDLPPLDERKDGFKNMMSPMSAKPTLNKKEQLPETQRQQVDAQKQIMFAGMLERFRESNDDNISTVMLRLSQTTSQFQRLSKGYTSQSYQERGTFLQFIKKDILLQEDEADGNVVQDEGPLQKFTGQTVGPITEIEEASSSSEQSDQDQQEEQKATTQGESSLNQMQKNMRSESLLGGRVHTLYSSSSIKQKSKSPQHANLLRPEVGQLSKFGGTSSYFRSGNTSIRQVSRATPKGSVKSGRITPSYRSAHDQSDNEDDFHSARGSLDSYRDAVGEALDVFYSFHEKRPLTKTELEDDTNEEDFQEVIVQPVNLDPEDYIRETEAEGTNSFSESLLLQKKKTEEGKKEDSVQKSSMMNILNDVKDVRCEMISILAINDFNSGFTPVLQLEMSSILMNQQWFPENTDTAVELPVLLINYYNLELGEWEPLLERTQVSLRQMNSKTESAMSIDFKEPICLNSTEQCLKNLFHTYKSWMQTPQFFTNSKSNKKQHLADTSISDRIRHSLNSDDEDDNQMNEVQSRLIYNSIRESVLVKKAPISQNKKNNRDHINKEIDVEVEYVRNEKKSVGELVTPFSIVNYTTRTIKIVRGGIKVGTGQFSEVKQFSSQLPKDLTESEKIYVLAPRQQTDYAVTYDHLMGIQKETQPGQDQPPDLAYDGYMETLSNNPINSIQMDEDQQREKLRKLKNKEIVGIQLSELDFVPNFDLNKNTGQNPWVHEISNTSNESVVSSFVSENKVDLEQPLLTEEQQKKEENEIFDTLEQRKIRNRVFYGTLIKDMRKFLIVRAPYCLFNKSSLNFEIKITETAQKTVKSKFRVQRGDIMGVDQQFYRNHSLQLRIAKDGNLYGGLGSENQDGWSNSVQISELLNLQMNEGTGVFLTTFDGQSYCTCIKRQQGQLNGTADLVLLPVITINNCLPSLIQIRPLQQKAGFRATQIAEEPIKPLYTEIYTLEQSQEKQFYTFSPTKYKDDRQVIQIEVLVQGFDWAPIDLHIDDYAVAEEQDFEITDLSGYSVKIGLRIQFIKAGFHLVFYAHACLLIESVLALPMMKICYKGRNFRQMKPLANSDELSFRKYLLCNKDSNVVVGIMDVPGQARPTYSFSPPLEIKQAGKQINFKVVTQGTPEDDANIRYDFVCTPTLQLAHYQESIYTKLVLISPRYVLVNKTKGYLRIAQHTAEDITAKGEQIFTPGEKREWFWPNGELPESQLKIIIQKLQPRVQINTRSNGSDNQIEKLLQLEQFGKSKQDDRRLSESDKVLNWNWSAPISLSEDDQTTFPIVQSEQGGLRKKILIIGKKIVGSTTFITIRDEKQTDFPTYIIKNSCPNLRLGFSQEEQQVVVPWHLEEMQQVSYAHVDPLSSVRTLTFHLTIDKELKRSKFKQHCFVRELNKIDIETEEVTLIDYTDLNAQPHQIEVKLINDGQTKTLSFSPLGQRVLNHQEEMHNQRKQQFQLASQVNTENLQKSLLVVTINTFCFSLVGYTKLNLYDNIEKNYRPVRERNEIALFTIQGLLLTQNNKNQDSEQEVRLVIDKFQVDNQSSQNPLFQTIFKKKSSSPDVKFLTLDLKRYISKDKKTNYVENFKMELAKCTLKFDDEFLVSFSQAAAAASQTNEDNSSGVHPLFMKENFYEQFDKIDLYLSTQQIEVDKQTDNRQSQTFVTAAQTDRSQRRQTIKPTQFGVYTTDEIKCPQQAGQIPMAFRHWVMQDQIIEDSSKIYLKKFEISTISFELSFVFKTKKGERQELTGPMNYLQSTGLTLVSIDEADFTLQPYKVQKKYLGQQDFIAELVVHFSKQALQEATKLPFSVGVIGSPRNLLKYAQIGITDFVELPRRGFERSWYSGIGGVALGTVSMLKNFSIGTFQFTQGISHGFSNLCVLAVTDKDYAIKREDEHLTQKPQNFVEGVGYGAKSFLYSFYSAGSGVITRPIIETRRLRSLHGFGKGVWQATSGLIGKPLSGALDFFSKSSEGIKNTFRIFEKYDDKKGGRIRQPRTLYSHQRQIKTFIEDDAFMVSNVLCTIKNGVFSNDHYIDMRLIRTANENQTPHFLLWTEENLFLIEATQKALVWHIESKNIQNVTNLNNGLMIYLDEKQDYAGRAQVGLPLDSKHQVDIRQWLDQIKNSNA